jgi:hypothetical protein
LRGSKDAAGELDHNKLPDPLIEKLEHLERELARYSGSYVPRTPKKNKK